MKNHFFWNFYTAVWYIQTCIPDYFLRSASLCKCDCILTCTRMNGRDGKLTKDTMNCNFHCATFYCHVDFFGWYSSIFKVLLEEHFLISSIHDIFISISDTRTWHVTTDIYILPRRFRFRFFCGHRCLAADSYVKVILTSNYSSYLSGFIVWQLYILLSADTAVSRMKISFCY